VLFTRLRLSFWFEFLLQATKDDDVDSIEGVMAEIQWCDRCLAKANIGTRGHEVLNLTTDRPEKPDCSREDMNPTAIFADL